MPMDFFFFLILLKTISTGDCVSWSGLELVLVLGRKFPSGRSFLKIQVPFQVGTTVDHFNVNVSCYQSNFR